MGSPCDIQLFACSKLHAEQTAKAVITDVNRLEARFSRYRADSFLSEINRIAAQGGRIQVDDETASLLNYAEACWAQSDGLFDVTSGILRRVWSFADGVLPSQQGVADVLAKVGWHKLIWQAPQLSFPIAGMELDFGGIVKEYAVDRASVICLTAGIRHGIVNLGGDIKVIGARPDGLPWRVGIRHPRVNNGVLDTLELSQGALATSGDYERCLLIDGVRYGHVLNPKTGWPVAYLASVSVVADFCVVAGSASTIALLKEATGTDWLKQLGLHNLWVDVNGKVGGSLKP